MLVNYLSKWVTDSVEILGNVYNGTRCLNFGGDLDHYLDSGILKDFLSYQLYWRALLEVCSLQVIFLLIMF